MNTDRVIICRCCSSVSTCLGLFLMFMALVEDTMPASLLDQVLSQEELKDPIVVGKTQKLLMKAKGSRWLFWALSGYTSLIIGLIGLWASTSTSSSNDGKKLVITGGTNR